MSRAEAKGMSSKPAQPTAARLAARRIRFAATASPAEKVLRQFTRPHAAVAIEDPSGPADLEIAFELLGPSNEPYPPVTLRIGSTRVQWRPGRAVVEGPADDVDKLVDALIEFAFLEMELRRVETALLPLETAAPADVPLAFRIRYSARPQWKRLLTTMEELAVLRLAFARLEPAFGGPPPALPLEGRRIFARLLAKGRIEERLEGLSDRLEACEDLYEGAVDRISDYLWYRKGLFLELGIVALLALELVVIIYEVLP